MHDRIVVARRRAARAAGIAPVRLLTRNIRVDSANRHAAAVWHDVDADIGRVTSARRLRGGDFHLSGRGRCRANVAIDSFDFDGLTRGELTAPLESRLRGRVDDDKRQSDNGEGENSAHASLRSP